MPHTFSLLLILVIDVFSLWLSLFLVAMILYSFIYYLRLHVFQSLNKSVLSIRRDSTGNWLIKTSQNPQKNVSLSGSSFVSNYLIILNYKSHGLFKNNTVLLTVDSLSKDDFRHLSVAINTTKSDINH